MEEQYKIIEGTLARTKERKDTILFRQAKKADYEDRLAKLGIREIPTDPLKVSDAKVVKYVLFKVKQQLGEKKVLINDEEKMNIAKVGEAQLRAANNSINKLARKQREWEWRLNELLGKPHSEDISPIPHIFFGCARSLPEASKQGNEGDVSSFDIISKTKVDDDESEDSEHDSSASSSKVIENELNVNSAYQNMISNLFDGDNCILRAEKEAEKKYRSFLSPEVQRRKMESELILSFDDEAHRVPPEEFFKERLMSKRKESLKARLAHLKNDVMLRDVTSPLT